VGEEKQLMGFKKAYLQRVVMSINIDDICVDKSASILEVLKIINETVKQLVLVVDKNKKLIGTINDGDIRRALLNNVSLNSSIEYIYFKTPTVANVNATKQEIINICTAKKIHQIPIIDNDGNIVALEILDELIKAKTKSNKVVLMVGGLGTRLRPLTKKTPKPMLHVGGKPILQTIVEKFADYGFVNIVMCVNYKSHIIQDYFGDGHKFGVKIEYIFEEKRMGTVGALTLLKTLPSEPFFIMNGDILTNINFEHLYNFHLQNSATATMCVREYDFQVPFGVASITNKKITKIVEKPSYNFFVSAGIYMLNPQTIKLIPKNEFYDMPTLFDELIKQNKNTMSFHLKEYWLDIGQMQEYEQANREYFDVFES